MPVNLLVTVNRKELEGRIEQEIIRVLSQQVIQEEENIIFIPKQKCLQSIITTLNVANAWYAVEPMREARNA